MTFRGSLENTANHPNDLFADSADNSVALHHIIVRAIDWGKIFQDPTNKRYFLQWLAGILKKC